MFSRKCQMARIKRYRKIRTAAFFVGRIDRRIQPLLEMRADGCHQMPACRKPQYADLVRIDMPLRGMKPYQPHRPLRILQRHRRLRICAPAEPTSSRNPILQQHASDPFRRSQSHTSEPSRSIARTDSPRLGTRHRRARVLSLWRIDRHRWLRDVGYGNPWGPRQPVNPVSWFRQTPALVQDLNPARYRAISEPAYGRAMAATHPSARPGSRTHTLQKEQPRKSSSHSPPSQHRAG